MKYQHKTIPKFTEMNVNEDTAFSSETCIAVSDGAGGCGLFADKWSEYLIEKLPKDSAFLSFEDLDAWVEQIWPKFYTKYEKIALQDDGMFLSKFYKEGSCATIAAAWIESPSVCRWMAYGDSVVFHYNCRTDTLEHSFTHIADFSNSPHLVSCNSPLEKGWFRNGLFQTDEHSIVFVASDALSYYLLMMYEIAHLDKYSMEIEEACSRCDSNSQMINTAKGMNYDFYHNILLPLCEYSSEDTFTDYMKKLYEDGLLDIDDFSIAFFDFTIHTNN
jgi:hypothetical protein